MGFFVDLFVPGHAVRPQFVGAPFMTPVTSVEYDGSTTGHVSHSDTFGLPQGPWTLYNIQAGRRAPELWFHFPLHKPTQLIWNGNGVFHPGLSQVFVLWSASTPAITLREVVVFDGTTALTLNGPPASGVTSHIPFNGPLTDSEGGGTTFVLPQQTHVVQFGLGVSARFTIDEATASNGTLQFFGAGARFMVLPGAVAESR